MINALGFGISTLAPWLFGLVLDRGLGYFPAYLVLAAFGAAGALGVLAFRTPPGSRSKLRGFGAGTSSETEVTRRG
jgi:hypothetical protein